MSERNFPKTHSLKDLVYLCKDVAPKKIESELEDIEILSSYGVEVRYPDEINYDIPEEDAQEAIDLAKKVKIVIFKYLEGKIYEKYKIGSSSDINTKEFTDCFFNII